jgi:hypothetical protein
VARLLQGQKLELAVRVMEQLRELSADGVPRVYQAALPEGRFLTVSDIAAKGRRMLLFQAPASFSPYRRVRMVLGRPRRLSADRAWFAGLTPREHRSAVSSIAHAISAADNDFEPLPGATRITLDEPVAEVRPDADAALDDAAVQWARATDAPVPGRDPALTAVVVAASGFAAVFVATFAGIAASALSSDLLSAGLLAAVCFGAVAGVGSLAAAAMGPEPGTSRAGGIVFALLGTIAILPGALQLENSSAATIVIWMLAAAMFLISWALATGVYGLWWLSIALPLIASAVGAPVAAAIDADGPGWGYVLGAGLVLAATALAFLTLVRSPTLIPHRRAALAELRRLDAERAATAASDPR